MTALPSRPSPQRAAAPTKVLVAHGDPDLRGRLARACERTGLGVDEASTGAEGLRKVFESRPDAVVLGAELPDTDGFALLERVRELCDTPVLMVHRNYSEQLAVRALRAGADAVVAQPIGVPETMARIEALLRRHDAGRQQDTQAYADAVVEINALAAEVRVLGRPVQLTPLEFRLLWEFVTHPRQTLGAERLLERVWGEDVEGRERVKIYVGYLRAKFREQGAQAPIVTVRGFGYRYEPPK